MPKSSKEYISDALLNEYNLIKEKWVGDFEKAIFLWSKFIKLNPPRFCLSEKEEENEGLTGSFAMIRLDDHAVVVSIPQIYKYKIQDQGLAVLAHEIGHHVYCPADLTDHGRMIARIRRGLPGKENLAGFISNLYSDLLINDKIKREFEIPIEKIYQALGKQKDKMWNFYMRIYEILWGLPSGTLVSEKPDDTTEGDAQLGNRLIRSYAKDWLSGAGRFAALCYPYIVVDDCSGMRTIMRPLLDAEKTSGNSNFPVGLTELDEDEISGAVHPAMEEEKKNPPLEAEKNRGSGGQFREPFEYGQILKDLGLKLSAEEITMIYYKERAAPYLIPFPVTKLPESKEPLMEGTEIWDIGSPIENIDWFQTAMKSPVVIMGYTTVEQVYGTSPGKEPEKEPIDLDIYIDCSGSMPDPSYSVSYLALAGTIIALSALRVGSKVQATLWSGPKEFKTTKGFISDEKKILSIIVGYLGGSTAFPIHILRDTYKERPPGSRKVHILVVSDDGVTTMFDRDEFNNSGWKISETALKNCGDRGTFVLNLWQEWKKDKDLVSANKQGWDIHRVTDWEELIKFASEFSKKNYGETK